MILSFFGDAESVRSSRSTGVVGLATFRKLPFGRPRFLGATGVSFDIVGDGPEATPLLLLLLVKDSAGEVVVVVVVFAGVIEFKWDTGELVLEMSRSVDRSRFDDVSSRSKSNTSEEET